LQSKIGRETDKDKYVIFSSLSLTAAFDLVDGKLFIKRLKIIGLQDDTINLIKERRTNRSYYINIDGDASTNF
jgi:hypothetical protein